MDLASSSSDGVLELRLNRPQRLNALTHALVLQLHAALRQGLADEAVHAILICGEGRTFCAGKDRDDPATPDFVTALQALVQTMIDAPKPLVCATQGWVVGAGLELMLGADVVIAARGARFSLPEVNVGLFGTGGLAALLPRAVGLQKAKGLMMLGQEISAADAERWGLVWQLVDDDALHDQALHTARALARKSLQLLAEIKQLLRREHLGEFGESLRREAEVHRRLAP